MRTHGILFRLLAAALLALPARGATSQKPSEIIVSAANYAETPPEVLSKMFRRAEDLTEVPPPPAPVADRPQRYFQFLPGENLEADLTQLEVWKLLLPPLAAKGFFNTKDPEKTEFLLRVTYGGRQWRDPFVRKDNLEWTQGLVPKKRGGSLDASQAWDDRAGGDESALYQLERDLTAVSDSAEGMADRLIGGKSTEDYYLIVVDAFEVAALKKTGNKTPRAWTTFIALPRQKGVNFSDVAARMIEKAAPWFSETLPGKAHFTDREGTVKLADPTVVEENVAVPKK